MGDSKRGSSASTPSTGAAAGRLALRGEGRERLLEDFARDVRAGLTSAPKRLPCAWLYDRRGSELFEEICALPEYYLTRAEQEILERRCEEILAALPPRLTLVELGSGSSLKTRVLIEALLRRQQGLTYVPIDISRSMLEASARALLDEHPDLRIRGIAAEYRQGLKQLREVSRGPRLVLWLGSNIGNFPPAEAVHFLGDVRGELEPSDRLLVGADLRKDRRTLELAYDDPAGVTARFNLNLLARIDRELGGDFDLGRFRHTAAWSPERGCMEMHLESLADQEVHVRALGLVVPFAAGERIHTEDSHKYSPRELRELAAAAGLRTERAWRDSRGRFSVQLLGPDAA